MASVVATLLSDLNLQGIARALKDSLSPLQRLKISAALAAKHPDVPYLLIEDKSEDRLTPVQTQLLLSLLFANELPVVRTFIREIL